MKNIVYTALAISLCLSLGKFLSNSIGGMPASLYGMVIYCLLLQLNWLKAEKVQTATQWVIRHMGVCFIPASAGVINHFELFQNHGLSIVAIIFFSTFALITVVAVLTEKYLTPNTATFINKG